MPRICPACGGTGEMMCVYCRGNGCRFCYDNICPICGGYGWIGLDWFTFRKLLIILYINDFIKFI